MTRYAILAVFATTLMLGGCQYNGTIDGSKLLADVEKIVITKKPGSEDSQDNDGGIQLINYPSYSIGTYGGNGVSTSIIGTPAHKRLIMYTDSVDIGNGRVDVDKGYISVSGPPLLGLPSGTVTYGGVGSYNSFFHIQTKGIWPLVSGTVQAEVNFDTLKMTQFDGVAVFDRELPGEPGQYEQVRETIVELRNSNEITINPATGKFDGTATHFKDSPQDLAVNGHFHGSADASGISGILYNEKARGGFVAECTTC